MSDRESSDDVRTIGDLVVRIQRTAQRDWAWSVNPIVDRAGRASAGRAPSHDIAWRDALQAVASLADDTTGGRPGGPRPGGG